MEETKQEKKSIGKKVASIILDVIAGLFAVTAIFMLVITVSSKKDSDGAATIFGTQLRFVLSDSMEECEYTDVSSYAIKSIPVKSCVFIETVPEDETKKEEWYSSIKIGDVLTFKYVYSNRQIVITHRVVKIEAKGESDYIYTLEGDNRSAKDNVGQQIIDTSLDETSPNYIIGKVTGQSYALGVIIYALKTPIGIIFIVIVPCVIVMLYEGMRIIMVIKQDKDDKIKDEQDKKNAEIASLKKELEMLKGDNEKKEETPEER